MSLHERFIRTATDLKLKSAFVTAGGGVGLFKLFAVPGASKTMIEAQMLYAEDSFQRFFDGPLPKKFMSPEMADQMALRIAQKSGAELSVALTCALKTDRERRGEDAGFLSIMRTGEILAAYRLEPGGNTRLEQDESLTRQTLTILLENLGNPI